LLNILVREINISIQTLYEILITQQHGAG